MAKLKQYSATKTISRVYYQRSAGGDVVINHQTDVVVQEQALQLTLRYLDAQHHWQQTDFSVLLRTPTADQALIVGFLFAEGIIDAYQAIAEIELNQQQALVTLAKPQQTITPRTLINHSGCGSCAKQQLSQLAIAHHRVINQQTAWLTPEQVFTLPEQLTQQQALFKQTGANHGALLVQGDNSWLAEDVGRHNAVDKVIGQSLIDAVVLEQAILVLSGRVSFELMQKAITAGIPVVVAVGAPSAMALSMAQQYNITLIGFVREQGFNLYHGDFRIDKSYLGEEAIL